MKLISEEAIEVNFVTEEDDNKKKNYFIEGIFMQSETKNRNGATPMLWAAQLPRRPMVGSISAPVRRLVSPRPRPSPLSAWCSPCWPSTSAGCVT